MTGSGDPIHTWRYAPDARPLAVALGYYPVQIPLKWQEQAKESGRVHTIAGIHGNKQHEKDQE